MTLIYQQTTRVLLSNQQPAPTHTKQEITDQKRREENTREKDSNGWKALRHTATHCNMLSMWTSLYLLTHAHKNKNPETKPVEMMKRFSERKKETK